MNRLTERFFAYVQCASESHKELPFAQKLAHECEELGLHVEFDEAGEKCGSNANNLRAFLQGEGEPIMFCAHMDTVSPGEGIKPRLEDGIIRSDGTTVLGADDKSGIAAVMEAVERIIEEKAPHRPVELLFTVCEECGLLGSRYADYSAFKSKEAVVLDSSKLHCVVNRAPAHVVLSFTVCGKSSHAGCAPENGIHALKAAAQAVNAIPCGHVDDMSVMNVADFMAPGQTNVVPDRASFSMEIRSFSEELMQKHIAASEKAVQEACAFYGARYEMTSDRHSDALYVPEEGELLKQMTRISREKGQELKVEGSFGGCDATWLNANGIAAVNLGTGMRDVHGVQESIAEKDLEATAELLYALIRSE